jgi:hypothetical protein
MILLFTTVVPDDDHVPRPFEEHIDDPSGTRTPPTPDVTPSYAPPPPAHFLRQRAMAQIFHPCQLIEAISMCMEQSIVIRYGCCISAPASNMPVIEIIVID